MLVHQLIYQGEDNRIAFYDKTEITYKQLQQEVVSYRDYFFAAGIRAGENVGLFSRNSVEFVISYMAIASLGAVVVPLNFQLAAREIAYIVKDAQMKHLVSAERLNLAAELAHYGYQQQVTQLIIPEFNQILAQQRFSPAPPLDAGFSDSRPCVIIYTSGTTGNPKGAILTHKNLISNAAAFREVLPVQATDNVLCVLPMYHCFAWTCAVLNALLCGSSITILEAFSPKETIATINKYGVSVVYGVPPMYNFLSRMGEADDLANVRFFVSGGASLPEKVAVQFLERYGKNIIEGYGLSEASPVVTLNPVEKTKYYSIGKALPGLDVKVLGSKDEPLPPGVVGELVVKGPSVMLGYYNLPLETSLALRDGWLHTGDLAYQDKDGYFYIVDRLKDMIISNGENIYPRQIEELLYAYPGITEAAVIGVPDELRGQAACAYIVMGEGQTFDKKAVKEYLQTHLAGYKIPRDFIVIDTLPKNQTGKVLKRVLRERVENQDDRERVG